MWDLGEFLGMPSVGAEAERLPQAGLPCHEGYNSGMNCVPKAVQRGGIQRHKNLAVHDGRRS